MKEVSRLIIQDLKHLAPGLAAAALFCILMEYFFGAVCLSRVLFGLPCPACGLTRAGLLLLHGNLSESLRMHPLLLLIPPGAVLYLREHYGPAGTPRYFKVYSLIVLGLFIGLYLVRMCLYFPGEEPMLYDRDNLLLRALRRNRV